MTTQHDPARPFLSPGWCHAAELDARERAAKQAADPDQGWTFTTGRRIRTHRQHHRAADRSPPFYARGLRNGRDEYADGWSEEAALFKLRDRLGLVSSDPTPPGRDDGR